MTTIVTASCTVTSSLYVLEVKPRYVVPRVSDEKCAGRIARFLTAFPGGASGVEAHVRAFPDETTASVAHKSGRRLTISLPAVVEALDGEAGARFAEAATWLQTGQEKRNAVHAVNVKAVIGLRAILHGKRCPRRSEKAVLNAMAEFDIGRDDAELAVAFRADVYRRVRNYVDREEGDR